jgi:hypothetical protein
MKLTETQELLQKIALVDNRKVTGDTVKAWHELIGGIPYDIATEAVKLAQQDPAVKYLEPRHVVGWSKEAAFRLDRSKPKAEPQRTGDPMPSCRDHGKPILTCDPCAHRLYKFTEARGFEGLERFARAEIYA